MRAFTTRFKFFKNLKSKTSIVRPQNKNIILLLRILGLRGLLEVIQLKNFDFIGQFGLNAQFNSGLKYTNIEYL